MVSPAPAPNIWLLDGSVGTALSRGSPQSGPHHRLKTSPPPAPTNSSHLLQLYNTHTSQQALLLLVSLFPLGHYHHHHHHHRTLDSISQSIRALLAHPLSPPLLLIFHCCCCSPPPPSDILLPSSLPLSPAGYYDCTLIISACYRSTQPGQANTLTFTTHRLPHTQHTTHTDSSTRSSQLDYVYESEH